MISQFSENQLSQEIQKQRLTPASELLRISFLIYIRKIRTIFAISGVGFFLTFVFVAGMIYLIPFLGFSESSFTSYSLSLFIAIGTFVLETLITGSLIYAIGEDKNFSESIQQGLKKMPPLLFALILSSFLIGLGMLALFIPGIIFAVWFCFVSLGVVLEDKGPVEALNFSKNLVSGRWWSVAWRLFWLTFVILILSVPLQLAFNFVLGPLTRITITKIPTLFPGNTSFSPALFKFSFLKTNTTIVNLIPDFFIRPLLIICLWLMYFELRRSKEV